MRGTLQRGGGGAVVARLAASLPAARSILRPTLAPNLRIVYLHGGGHVVLFREDRPSGTFHYRYHLPVHNPRKFNMDFQRKSDLSAIPHRHRHLCAP
jgi:hypothetical protein